MGRVTQMIDDKNLPLQFVKDILAGLAESKSGKLSDYQLGINTKAVTDIVLKNEKHKISDEVLNHFKIDGRK